MKSWWTEGVQPPDFPALQGDLKTDVLIIGGGLAGLLCAYLLHEAGVDCVLVEAEEICSGITQNTTAKITLQHGLIYDTLIRTQGLEKARLYLQANQAALDVYRRICPGMDCDFEEKDNYVYALKDRQKLEKEVRALEALGCDAHLAEHVPLPVAAVGAVQVKGQAQFHPLKFAYALAKGLPICRHTRVLEMTPRGARTAQGFIRSDRTIVATHFPFINKHGSYFMKMYQHRSYVLAMEGAPDVRGMYVDEDAKGMSFRNAGGVLLLGGGGHRTGKQGGNWQELRAFAQAHYPDARIMAQWAAQDCMTLDGLPYIGPYSRRTPALYVATGFNKWGVTGAMTAAMLLRDMLLGRDAPYARVFCPSRSMVRPQLFVNLAETALNLMTPTTPRCPHLGCALKYNAQEHSWDCPCHGSRFAQDGRLLDNPATGDLKK